MDFVRLKGRLYFGANDGTIGSELWRTDGTKAGTKLVEDINPAAGSSPFRLAAFKHRVYFSADDGTHGRELWRTDGSAQGTKLFKDIRPGMGGSIPCELVKLGEATAVRRGDRPRRLPSPGAATAPTPAPGS